MRVSFVLPAYNEEEKLQETVESVFACARPLALVDCVEVIVVDDGSIDNTATIARRLAAEPNLARREKVIDVTYKPNRGKGFALFQGLKYAGGDVIFFFDSDSEIRIGTDDLERYLKALERSHIAIGSKRHPEAEVESTLTRRFLSWAFFILATRLTGLRVSDTQAGLKAFRKEAIAEIAHLRSVNSYAYDVEVLLLAKLLGFVVAELPVKASSKTPLPPHQVLLMVRDLLVLGWRVNVSRTYHSLLNRRPTP